MDKVVKVFKVLGDKNRLRILKLLEKNNMCVCELAFVLEIAQPSVSRHLKKLKKAGLVESEKEDFWTDYFIKDNNKYASTVLVLIEKWLNNNDVIKKDLEKMKRADRKKLCCTE